MTIACRLLRIRPLLGMALTVLVAPACEAQRTAEFEIEVAAPLPDGQATLQALERALERRASEAGLRDFSLKWTGAATGIVRVTGVDDLDRTARLLSLPGTIEFRLTDMTERFRTALPAIDRVLADAGILPTERVAPTGMPGSLLDTETPQPATPLGPLASRLSSYGGLPGQFLCAEEEAPLVDSLLQLPEVATLIPQELQLVWGAAPISQGGQSYVPLYAVERHPLMTGEEIEDATAQRDRFTERAVVLFTLTADGGRRFAQETRQHVDEFLAIVLDGQIIGQPPIIRTEIGRHGQFELGDASFEKAQDLTLALRTGALPVPLTVVKAEWVGPDGR